MVVSVNFGFMHFAIVGQREDFQRKKPNKKLLIWLIFSLKSGSYLCVCVPKFACY